jgi:hypothetical protein
MRLLLHAGLYTMESIGAFMIDDSRDEVNRPFLPGQGKRMKIPLYWPKVGTFSSYGQVGWGAE